ncbi:MAG: hypothetical protein JSW59_15755 [Phycisphaerales bacterium]|nr:MAG: hypothetical protein JSW59_15755 [Phycisphaerales bacterium]
MGNTKRQLFALFGLDLGQIVEPRHFDFNSPFLIYVKKRGADYSPFFVMWVDNAELMQQFDSSD